MFWVKEERLQIEQEKSEQQNYNVVGHIGKEKILL
jgi:hypothetical protein